MPERRGTCWLLVTVLVLFCWGCNQANSPNTAVVIIEASPLNLDPRVGLDAQSERIDKLIFDPLVFRDEHFNFRPGLATSWEVLNPLTYVFHLRRGVRFHDGRPLTARDVKWTLDSFTGSDRQRGHVVSVKAGAFEFLDHIEAPDDWTVVFHMKQPDARLLWNVSDGAIGIVPYGSSDELSQAPVGTGPFRFVSQAQDREVVLERNADYWGERARIARVRFAVVPDTTPRALESRKGSADAAINALPPDLVLALQREKSLTVERAPGTILAYVAFNLTDPALRDVRVRRAIACAVDRAPMIRFLWRGMARPAMSLLPPEHWAFNLNVATYKYDPARARALLDEAGYNPTAAGVRLRLSMKTTTEESSRLIAAILQQQLADVGIALDIRSFEPATFMADVARGAFQIYSLRWIGGNEDPDIFDYVFNSERVPPAGANRGHYRNPRVDELLAEGRRTVDQRRRREIFAEVQRIIAEDAPYINLWYLDNVLVHSRRLRNVHLAPSGSYDFLKTAELGP